MDFWATISANSTRPLSVEVAAAKLEEALASHTADEIRDFCVTFDERMDEAYTWDLWGVAYLIQGGCSDDAFMDFRASLIGLGETTFTSAVRDPESLMELPDDELQGLFEEGLLYPGVSAYEAVTGGPPERVGDRKPEPSGVPWEEDAGALAARFPRTWERYGWDTGGDSGSGSGDSGSGDSKPWWKFW